MKTLYVLVIGDLLARRGNHGLHIDLTLWGYHQLMLGLPEEPNEMNHIISYNMKKYFQLFLSYLNKTTYFYLNTIYFKSLGALVDL